MSFIAQIGRLLIASIAGVAACASIACGNRASEDSRRLPNLVFVNRDGREVSLATMGDGLVLMDFIYTSCNGPCPTMTSKMAVIGQQLGQLKQTPVRLVSITIDPEHDTPSRMWKFARAFGASSSDWYFLAGRPEDTDRVLATLGLPARRAANGYIQHVTSIFLFDSSGHELREYDGVTARPKAVAADIARLNGRG